MRWLGDNENGWSRRRGFVLLVTGPVFLALFGAFFAALAVGSYFPRGQHGGRS